MRHDLCLSHEFGFKFRPHGQLDDRKVLNTEDKSIFLRYDRRMVDKNAREMKPFLILIF